MCLAFGVEEPGRRHQKLGIECSGCSRRAPGRGVARTQDVEVDGRLPPEDGSTPCGPPRRIVLEGDDVDLDLLPICGTASPGDPAPRGSALPADPSPMTENQKRNITDVPDAEAGTRSRLRCTGSYRKDGRMDYLATNGPPSRSPRSRSDSIRLAPTPPRRRCSRSTSTSSCYRRVLEGADRGRSRRGKLSISRSRLGVEIVLKSYVEQGRRDPGRPVRRRLRLPLGREPFLPSWA